MSAPSPATCPNCGHRLAPWDKFCAQCGQDTANHPPSLWEFIHEFLLHYVAFEGKLWKSLWALVANPGFLTAEYLAGRKQRYVLPLRLVLTLGLVFFLALKLTPGDPLVHARAKPPQADQTASAPQAAAVPDPLGEAAEAFRQEGAASAVDADLERVLGVTPKPLHGAIARAKARFEKDEPAEWRRIGRQMLAWAPYAVLASLPFYAGLLALLYLSRRQPFGAHFVFAMHLHAAWYAVLLLGQLPGWVFSLLALFWANAYPLLALKRVYGGAWWATLLRATVLLFLHLALLLVGVVVLGLLGALT